MIFLSLLRCIGIIDSKLQLMFPSSNWYFQVNFRVSKLLMFPTYVSKLTIKPLPFEHSSFSSGSIRLTRIFNFSRRLLWIKFSSLVSLESGTPYIFVVNFVTNIEHRFSTFFFVNCHSGIVTSDQFAKRSRFFLFRALHVQDKNSVVL